MGITTTPPGSLAPPPPSVGLRIRGIVLRVSLVIGLGELGFATIVPLLPLYLTEHLNASVKLVGAVVAAFALVETFLKAGWGSVADRVGRRPLIVAGLLLSSVAPLLMSVLRNPVLFVPLRLIDGAGSSALWPAASAIMADKTPRDQRATAMGTLNLFFLSGLAFGPALGLFVVGLTHSYATGFYLASGLMIAAAVWGSVALRDAATPHLAPPVTAVGGDHGDDQSSHRSREGRAQFSPLLITMLGVAFVQMFGVGLLAPILAIYAKQVVGLSEQVIGILFLLGVLSVAIASVPAGQLADRWGKRKAVVWGMAIGSAGMWMLPISPRLDVLAVGAVLLGIGYALSSPAWHALVSELAPPGRIGFAMGAAQTAEGLGLVLGPLLGGVLWDASGHVAPFVASASLLSVSTVALIITIRSLGRSSRARA
ncbi:MAG TPA: MFS transporter [bacterium]|nr:MFS transporter [bacterium]